MAVKAMREKKQAVGLIIVMLFCFYIGSIGVEYIQSAKHGYGSGFSHQYHVPQSVVRQVAVQDHLRIPATVTAKQLSDMTLGNHQKGWFNEVWRWVLTVAALIGVMWFWYFVCSRIGPV